MQAAKTQYFKLVKFVRDSSSLNEEIFEILAEAGIRYFEAGERFTPRQCCILFEYFKKFNTSILGQQLLKLINQQVNYCLENYDDELILLDLHNLLKMAGSSSQYLSRKYNPRFEGILRGKDAAFFDSWCLEETSLILKELTMIGVNKGTEELDAHFRTRLLSKVEEYKQKPYVLHNYLVSIIQREKFKKEMVHGFLVVIETFFDTMAAYKECSYELKRALYIIEDNLRPGHPDWEEERQMLAGLVNKNKEYVNQERNDELSEIRRLEKLDEEIKRGLVNHYA